MTFPDKYELHFNIEQGSLEWHELRAKHYPASETGAVMEVNPWQPKNRRELSAVRKGELHIEESLPMKRGTMFEDAARMWAESQVQERMPPAIVTRGEYMASLDGLSGDESVILELKVPMNPAKLYEAIASEKVPMNYWYQMAQQAHCAREARLVMFAAYDPKNETGKYMLIEADKLRAVFEEEVHPAWQEFKGSNYEPIEVVRDDDEFKAACAAYWEAKTAVADAKKAAGIKALEETEKKAKEALIEACQPGLANKGFGIRVGWAEINPGISVRKGSIRKTITGKFTG